jgi:phenylpropionate dioxygenase-like ring-hydroxylating dioxygenase large terminal subunit
MPAKLTTTALWTPVAPVERVKKHHGMGNNPLRVSLHDGRKKLSLFWDESIDGAGVVNDTCHHRGASLSNGIVGSGCVNCLYHGHPTKSKRRDVMTKDGIVWYNDKTFESTDDEVHSSWEFDEGQRVFVYEREFPACNAIYMQENTCDWKHLAHIHAFSFTDGDPDVVIHDDGRAADYVYDTKIPGTKLIVENGYWSTSTCLRFFTKRDNEDRQHLFSLHFAFVPVGKDHTRIIVRVTRSGLLWMGKFGDWAMMMSNELPLIEDRDIVKSIPYDRTWNDDHLCRDDAFLKLLRDHWVEYSPKMVQYYAGYTGVDTE